MLDAALFAVIGWRIRRMSRAWSIVGLCLYLMEAVVSLGTRDAGVGVLTIVFVLAYINGLRGVFAYHRYMKGGQLGSEVSVG